MDSLVRITKNINFGDLRTGSKQPIDVYEEQMNSWVFRALNQLAAQSTEYSQNRCALSTVLHQ